MSLSTLQDLGEKLAREDRLQEARNVVGRRIPRPGRERAADGRTGTFLSRFRARLQLATFWVQRNAPAIRHLWSIAVSYAAALVVAYGFYLLHPSAGYITAGLLTWGIQWNYGRDPQDGRVSPYSTG